MSSSSVNHTQVYLSNFIQSQVDTLNQPIKVTNKLNDIISTTNLSNRQVKSLVDKINKQILAQNEKLYSPDIHQQIITQVLKLERQKFTIVNQIINKIYIILQPILLPNFVNLTNLDKREKLVEFNELINELPDEKYLIINKREIMTKDFDLNKSPIDEDEEDDLDGDDAFINHEVVANEEAKLKKREYLDVMIKEVDQLSQLDQDLVKRYSELRKDLRSVHDKLKYKYDKLNFLNELKSDITETFHLTNENKIKNNHNNDEMYDSDEEMMPDDGSSNEIDDDDEIKGIQSNLLDNNEDNLVLSGLNKFRVLMEKINYKVNTNDISGSELRAKILEMNK
ncbi:unnamed protein product [Candida verbasci]|uniref:Uncharacterized protein n=1 Tax=Candida verbasci TaxID=1227364 RepID=A0A9W4XAP3_9ASCO|nr:unnamed protein product [Candida verbasci]